MSSQAETNKNILMLQKWGGMLIIFLTITVINGVNIKDHGSIYLFAIASWVVLLIGTIIREKSLDKADEDFMEFLPNAIVTVIYFSFVVNAISLNLHGQSGSTRVKGGSNRGPGIDKAYMGMAGSLSDYVPTTIFLAIFMVVINAISHLYTFSNCDDEDNKYVKSLLNAQYNIIIISILGAVAFVLVKKKIKKKI